MTSREGRIEAYYDGFSARELAEFLVDVEDEGARLKELLQYEHNRANSAIDREETAEQAAEEAREDAQYFEAWATGNGHALNAMTADRGRVYLAWQSARRRAKWAR